MTNEPQEQAAARRWHWPDTLVLLCASALLAGFVLPDQKPVPTLPDLTELEPQERKVEFLRYLDPLVARVNDDVRRQRARLAAVAARLGRGDRLTWHDRRYLHALAARYEVAVDGGDQQTLALLQRRVDVVPRSLVLVQAAKESGWGTSRFAIEGNNLFGQRCYESGCGLTPRRAEQAGFSVASYDSTLDSVREYARNLNTHL
jgi:Bax protein